MSSKQKLDVLIEKVKNPPSWWWKVLGGLVVIVVALVIKYQIDKQAAEIARLRNEAAAEKLKAEQEALRLKLAANNAAGKEAYDQALNALAAANAKMRDVEAKEKETGLALAKVAALKNKDWDALNKMAGV